GHLLGHDPRDHVGGAARGKADQDAYRTTGIALGQRRAAEPRAKRAAGDPRRGGHHVSAATSSVMLPMPSIVPFSRSPGASWDTPAGVPVVTSVPGCSVETLDRNRMRSRRPLIMSAVCARMTVFPFCSTTMCRSCGSRISSRVTIHGPRPQNVSNPLRMLRVLCRPLPHGSRMLMSQHIV